ncbi:MAG: pseudaminic acid cytidylyltransferase [Pseudomonadota bacterium]
MRLAVIPARGGSKRIAKKNIRDFYGKPLMAYSIEAALKCTAIDAVWVSTEDAGVASVARAFGAEVPFVRPQSLADDHTILQQVAVHALEYAKDQSIEVSDCCLVFATAPFLQPDDLSRGWACLHNANADFALSVSQFRNAPQRAQFVDGNGFLRFNSPQYCNVRSQDLEPLYHDAAQFVWGTSQAFLSKTAIDANVTPVEISADQVIDIDTPDDWSHAERLYRAGCIDESGVAA